MVGVADLANQYSLGIFLSEPLQRSPHILINVPFLNVMTWLWSRPPFPFPSYEFGKAVNMHMDKEEWDAYAASITILSQLSVPDYWASKIGVWPSLAPVAVYLIWLPVVVTSCDSVLSIEKHVLNTRRSRLDEDVASGLVAWKCNGKP